MRIAAKRDKLGRLTAERDYPDPDYRSGDPCPVCGGWIHVYRSIVVRGSRRQYLHCTTPSCSMRIPGSVELPITSEAPARKAS